MAYHHTVDDETLRELSPEMQRDVMETWFRSRFEDPAERTPYESREGGYIWIWGGPHEAEDELHAEFADVVPDEVIVALARELDAESPEWAPVPSEDDYDHALFEVVESNKNARQTLADALGAITRLLALPRDGELDGTMNRMLFASVIAALEAYLLDTFLNQVLNDDHVLRQFVETTPDLHRRSVAYSEIFRAAEAARDEAKRYLLDVVWHNLAKVQAMYLDTLNVDMRVVIPDVARAIPKRHDIVHRNGRDRDGNPAIVSSADVSELTQAVGKLADHVEKALAPDF